MFPNLAPKVIYLHILTTLNKLWPWAQLEDPDQQTEEQL